MGSQTSSYKPLNNNCQSNSILSVNESSSHRLRFTDETIDLFTLIWLDVRSKGNDLESLGTKKLLLEINQKCLFYDDCQLFFDAIDTLTFENKIILLIVSGSFVQRVLSRGIRDKISTVIIFCRHYYKYASLKNDWIVDICTDHKSLKNCIQREMPSLKLNLFENQPLKSTRSLPDDVINDKVYFTYILFIELFKQMPQTKQVKEFMLSKCEDYYRNSEADLTKINDFRRTYTPDQALKWYTSNTFVYRLVNRAFRTEDITLWYIFRSYITDLCMQLEQVHREQKEKFVNRCLTLYRGQTQMLTTELKDIQSRIGGLIATTGFLSTSQDPSVAEGFTVNELHSDTFTKVLYEIVLDTNDVKNTIFVDVVDCLSSRNEAAEMVISEREILFNIGSVFKIENVHHDEDSDLWHIKMKATDGDINTTKNQIESIKNKFQTGNMNLLFGQLLLNTGHYEKAASYFQLMLKVLPKHHSDLASVYDSIGNLNLRTTNWNEALKNFNNAYKIKMKSCSDKHAPDLGVTLYNLANYYKAIGDNTLALDFYRRSLKCVKNPINIALTKLNIGTILKINGQYLQALELCHESFSRLQQHDSCLYAEIITCQGLIGDIYYAQDEYNESEAFYLTAFELAKKHLFIDDLCLIHCINALADTYEKQDSGSQHRSIEFCNQQLALHEKNLPENHVSIAYILMKLGQLSDNIDFYQKALIIFEKNLHQEYASTAKCSISVAEYHHKRKMYEEALSFYTKAYQIQKKIYPANHSLIIQTEKVLTKVERKFKEESIAKRNAMTNTSL